MSVYALLGSGEFLPWARAVDDWCVRSAAADSDRVLIVPTASAPEGNDVVRRWAESGTAHYRELGLLPVVSKLRAREDAFNHEIVGEVAGSRLIFFSGGNPGYLAETCAETPFWDAVLEAVAHGTALAGCSAGAVFLGATAPFVANERIHRWVPGVGALPRAYVLPHFDALDSFEPGLRSMLLGLRPPGTITVGIDEDTALCGDGEHWRVTGKGAVWIGEDGNFLSACQDGETVTLPLDAGIRKISNP